METGDHTDRQTEALEETARNSRTLVLIAQVWSGLAVVALLVLLGVWMWQSL